MCIRGKNSYFQMQVMEGLGLQHNPQPPAMYYVTNQCWDLEQSMGARN
jgi:hypothetical protein